MEATEQSRTRRTGRWLLGTGAAMLIATAACSPIYVIRAGIAEYNILRARRPIPAVILDPATDARTRGKLTLALEARNWARDALGLDVGDSYTSFTQLDRDTLALVLSAAHRDRFVSKTWWFPIVGRVPYKGFFSETSALEAQADLERDGFDTYLRPTAAFSTLGWFADPLLSTLMDQDEVDLVETVLHELSHNHLFVSGRVRFNESFATFVGRAGAAQFFCTREGGGPDTVKCLRARARWRDIQRYSVFIDALVDDLDSVYGEPDLTYDEKLARREEIFVDYKRKLVDEVRPDLEQFTFQGFLDRPLNNATLLSQMRYYHRLPDFQRLLEARGDDVASAVAFLKEGADTVDDPFELLD